MATSAAETIKGCVARVTALREQVAASPDLEAATSAVKRFQAQRFAGTYADMLAGGAHADAARFFLDELYSERDYAERDAQFSRIAGPLQRLFPQRVVATAVAMAELHALTEALDHAMAMAWMAHPVAPVLSPAGRYLDAWRTVACAPERRAQLDSVLAMGRELERLVRTPGLRMALHMMRRPARAAGLGALQQFLELGFDTFAGLVAGRDAGAGVFLDTIAQREAQWMEMLFTQEAPRCNQQLTQCLEAAARVGW